jgi:hypothetical protein
MNRSRYIGRKGICPEGIGPEGIGPKGIGPEGIGPKGIGPKGIGPKGIGPEGLQEISRGRKPPVAARAEHALKGRQKMATVLVKPF